MIAIAAADNAIVTVEEVSEYLSLADGDTSQLDFLQRSINAATSAIENHLRGPVKLQSFTEIYDGDGTSKLWLRQKPAISLKTPKVEELQYRDKPGDSWLTLETTLAYIIFRPEEPWWVELYEKIFSVGTQNIQIQYNAGYATIPGAIQQVCIEKVAEDFTNSRRGGGRLGLSSISSGTAVSSTTSFKELSDRHKSLLQPYMWHPY